MVNSNTAKQLRPEGSTLLIRCPACQTKFSLEGSQLRGIAHPRFHCSRCSHYFALDDLKDGDIEDLSRGASNSQTSTQMNAQMNTHMSAQLNSGANSFGKAQSRVAEVKPLARPAAKPDGKQLDLISNKALLNARPSSARSHELPVVTASWPDPMGHVPLEADLRAVAPSFTEVMQKRLGTNSFPERQADSRRSGEMIEAKIEANSFADIDILGDDKGSAEHSMDEEFFANSKPSPAQSITHAVSPSDVTGNHNARFDDVSLGLLNSTSLLKNSDSQRDLPLAGDEHKNNFDNQMFGNSAFRGDSVKAVKDITKHNISMPSGQVFRNAGDLAALDGSISKGGMLNGVGGLSTPVSESVAGNVVTNSGGAQGTGIAGEDYNRLSTALLAIVVSVVPFALICLLAVYSNLFVLDALDTVRSIFGFGTQYVSPKALDLTRPQGRLVFLDNGAKVYELTGQLTNRSPFAVEEVVIEASLYDDKNNLLRSYSAFSDNPLNTSKTFSALAEIDIEEMMDSRIKPFSPLGAGKVEIYRLVVTDMPKDAVWYSVRVKQAIAQD